MQIDTTKDCEWLHNALVSLRLIKYSFKLEHLPHNGIYFFYEDGEYNAHNNKPRIVRVGTHKNNNFRSRINEHYLLDGMSFDNNSPAPKDRSIFRKNIGRALINKMNTDYLEIWDIDFTNKINRMKFKHKRDIAFEKKIEQMITKRLRDNFSFRYIEIADQEQRMGKKGLESRLIGTLSGCGLCKSSSKWIGRSSPKEAIQESGLWLIQHLKSEGIRKTDKDLILRLITDRRI
jgi:hypothetical protein